MVTATEFLKVDIIMALKELEARRADVSKMAASGAGEDLVAANNYTGHIGRRAATGVVGEINLAHKSKTLRNVRKDVKKLNMGHSEI